MQMNPGNFGIEAEIADLENKLQEKRKTLETVRGQSVHEKEALHDILREKIQEHSPSYIPISNPTLSDDTQKQSSSAKSDDDDKAPSYENPKLKPQIEDLVATAFSLGIAKAIKKATSSNNPALLDAFHDVMVDELYDYMVSQGTISTPK